MKKLVLIFVLISFAQTFAQNRAPVFVKEMPDTFFLTGKTLSFRYEAIDSDGDLVKYSTESLIPINATLDSLTGLFVWRPANTQRGKYELVVKASDGKLVTSSRKTIITIEFLWDDFGSVNYSCNPIEGGAIVNSMSNDTITAIAKANKGFVFKNWTVNGNFYSIDSVFTFKFPNIRWNIEANFRINHAPVFVKEMPDTFTTEGKVFVFTYKAIDPDGDTVKYYATTVFPNQAMLISKTGVFGWRPNRFQSGLFQIMIYASDGNMNTYSRTASVKVYPDCCMSDPPIIIRGLPESGGKVSYTMTHDTITVRAVSNKGFKFLNWTEYGTSVSTDSSYTYVVTEMRNLAAHFTTISSLYDEMGLPNDYSLFQNYPNPFNPETTISYLLPKSEHVTLKVYDALGREAATLVDEYKSVGKYNFQFSIHNSKLSSGVYFYQLKAGSFIETKKLVIMK